MSIEDDVELLKMMMRVSSASTPEEKYIFLDLLAEAGFVARFEVDENVTWVLTDRGEAAISTYLESKDQ